MMTKKKNRYWSKSDKLKIVLEVISKENRPSEVAKKYDISSGLLSTWTTKYILDGEEALENTKKPGNPLAKYQNKKELTPIEQLEYENMKLKIEVERLKKGYTVKGVGKNKEFVIINNKNSKSLKN